MNMYSKKLTLSLFAFLILISGCTRYDPNNPVMQFGTYLNAKSEAHKHCKEVAEEQVAGYKKQYEDDGLIKKCRNDESYLGCEELGGNIQELKKKWKQGYNNCKEEIYDIKYKEVENRLVQKQKDIDEERAQRKQKRRDERNKQRAIKRISQAAEKYSKMTTIEKGVYHYNLKEYYVAKEMWGECAADLIPECMNNLGVYYKDRVNNIEEAQRWWTLAARYNIEQSRSFLIQNNMPVPPSDLSSSPPASSSNVSTFGKVIGTALRAYGDLKAAEATRTEEQIEELKQNIRSSPVYATPSAVYRGSMDVDIDCKRKFNGRVKCTGEID
ncbi:MAG: hypothetical protein HOE35_05045 [Candidatus Ruthia sp.]|jgi:hypothetical protein|nr:hypothetical protein [Candidatus Ruthturnera sp.]MBT4992598.1 hypothetical protein [Candidatus Neomarinimicrobiota bacterium]MBT7830694.1 hypothetical protein [Candidatus Neomarinimicrobiota bacterium]